MQFFIDSPFNRNTCFLLTVYCVEKPTKADFTLHSETRSATASFFDYPTDRIFHAAGWGSNVTRLGRSGPFLGSLLV
jgi:hypothetical protein